MPGLEMPVPALPGSSATFARALTAQLILQAASKKSAEDYPNSDLPCTLATLNNHDSLASAQFHPDFCDKGETACK